MMLLVGLGMWLVGPPLMHLYRGETVLNSSGIMVYLMLGMGLALASSELAIVRPRVVFLAERVTSMDVNM
jgi:hypothetical protein